MRGRSQGAEALTTNNRLQRAKLLAAIGWTLSAMFMAGGLTIMLAHRAEPDAVALGFIVWAIGSAGFVGFWVLETLIMRVSEGVEE